MFKNLILLSTYETTRMWAFFILIAIGGITLLFPSVREFLMSYIKTEKKDDDE